MDMYYYIFYSIIYINIYPIILVKAFLQNLEIHKRNIFIGLRDVLQRIYEQLLVLLHVLVIFLNERIYFPQKKKKTILSFSLFSFSFIIPSKT